MSPSCWVGCLGVLYIIQCSFSMTVTAAAEGTVSKLELHNVIVVDRKPVSASSQKVHRLSKLFTNICFLFIVDWWQEFCFDLTCRGDWTKKYAEMTNNLFFLRSVCPIKHFYFCLSSNVLKTCFCCCLCCYCCCPGLKAGRKGIIYVYWKEISKGKTLRYITGIIEWTSYTVIIHVKGQCHEI